MKDPFQAAIEEEQEDSPPESPVASATDGVATQNPVAPPSGNITGLDDDDDYDDYDIVNDNDNHNDARYHSSDPSKSKAAVTNGSNSKKKDKDKDKEEDDDEDEDNMEVELSKLPSTADPNKMAKMQAVLSQFSEEQMSRYESFRRSGFQKASMKRLLVSITGSQKVSLPMTIAVCGIAKMFVGELVETARMVMTERKESGPIRPCHIREALRRLKLEGKVPRRSIPRLF